MTRYYVQVTFSFDEQGVYVGLDQLRQGEYKRRNFFLGEGPVLKLSRHHRDLLFKAYEEGDERVWERFCEQISEFVPEPWKSWLL